jgi:hypothetical protein
MVNKTLSIDPNAPIWERARRRAADARTSVSALVAFALTTHLGEPGEIEVPIYDNDGYSGPKLAHRVRFAGHWLTDPPVFDESAFEALKEFRGGWTVHIAETQNGRIAVYLRRFYRDPSGSSKYFTSVTELRVFETFTEAEHALQTDDRICCEDAVRVGRLSFGVRLQAIQQADRALRESSVEVQLLDI